MKHVCFLILIFVMPLFGIGQSAQQQFEQVPVRYHKFDWQQVSTPSFEIYYYKGGKNLANVAIKHVESEYLRICELLGYYNFEKMKLIIYLNEAQKSQSNIGKDYYNNPSGGESYYIKNIAEVAYPGSITEFKKELSRQIAASVVNEMLYGRGVKEIIRSSHFIKFPEWITLGLPAYLAKGWTVDLDGFMYENSTKPKISYLNGLSGEKAEIVGQSVWNYIVEEHGPITIANIMLLLRSTREIDVAISGSLDRAFSEFLHNWHRYYENNRAFLNTNFNNLSNMEVDYNFKIKNATGDFSFSPDRSKIAFAVHSNGYLKVFVYHVESGKKIKKFKRRINYSSTAEKNETILRWKNNDDLRVVYRSFGEYSLLYNLSSRNGLFHSTKDNLVLRNILARDFWNKKKLELPRFDNIQNFNYSKDGEQIIFSASSNGVSDLYIMLPRMKKTFRVTNDVFDDIDASFLDDDHVIFSSNRIDDSSNYHGNISEVEDNYDLYMFSIKNKSLQQLTSWLGHETKPKALNDSTILYLDDNAGTRRITQFNIKQKTKTGILNSCSNIKDFYVDKNSGIYAMIPHKKGLYFIKNGVETGASDTKKTHRQKVLEDRTRIHSFTLDTSRKWISTFVDTNAIHAIQKTPELAFSIKKTLSSFRIDPIFGSGLIGGVTLTDIFEDYRVNGQIFALTDFSSTIVSADLENKRGFIDYKISYTRKNIFYNSESYFSKFSIQNLDFKFSVPFMSRFAITVIPSAFQTSVSSISQITQPVKRTTFVGAKGQITLNNSIEYGANRLKGTRAMVSFETYYGVLSSDSLLPAKAESFNRLNVDVRNYKTLVGKITWANRFSMGKSLGASPKNFIFGGMDNWFFPRMALNEITSKGNASDLFYTSYATNMRGFAYNARNGNSYFMYNSELRIPLDFLFGNQVIRSGFMNNLQLNLFSDFGSAWTGNNPFNKNNSFNKQTFGNQGSTFQITVLNYRNPVVMGYGFGIRTVVFGSYVKADLGFGLEDYQGSTPMIMISLGNDF